jgi:hypothetical protein
MSFVEKWALEVSLFKCNKTNKPKQKRQNRQKCASSKVNKILLNQRKETKQYREMYRELWNNQYK